MGAREVLIKDTHRGLWYEDGVLLRVLEAGRYVRPMFRRFLFWRWPVVEVVLVDIRERELTIKGQEILTADKVAIRVSIIVQFRVIDPKAAVHEVEKYEDRLYSDVQLAARRSLASMPLEEILTNRNRLSEEILRDVKETAARYGVAILRADVKDLVFPGNLQEIMNKVLAAERLSQAQLVEARTKAQTMQIDAQAKAEMRKLEAESQAVAQRLSIVAEAEAQATSRKLAAQAEADALRIRGDAEAATLAQAEQSAVVFARSPALVRLRELEALKELATLATARIYIGFDKHLAVPSTQSAEAPRSE